jgi:hypothetical protein
MFNLMLKLLLAIVVVVCIAVAIFHAFPVIFIVLAVIGIHKLYQVIKWPTRPGDWW